jgi:hypothetical protein
VVSYVRERLSVSKRSDSKGSISYRFLPMENAGDVDIDSFWEDVKESMQI